MVAQDRLLEYKEIAREVFRKCGRSGILLSLEEGREREGRTRAIEHVLACYSWGKSFFRLPGRSLKGTSLIRCVCISFARNSSSAREISLRRFVSGVRAFVKGFGRGALNFHLRV